MHIEQISVRGFGKLKGLDIKLKKGLNIIYGSNEAGKTTLQWFIKGMLYGLKGGRASRDGLPAPLKRFRPWTGDSYGGSLEYRLDNGSLFRIDRNFDTNTVAVYDEAFNNITGTFELSKDKGLLLAEKHLGIPESCFDRTVMIRQLETRMDYSGSEELVSRLVNLSQTGQEDISFKKAAEVLKEALKEKIGTERTTARPMDRVTARLAELGERREKLLFDANLRTDTERMLQQLRMEEAVLKKRKEYLALVKGLIDTRNEADEERERINKLSELEARLCGVEPELEAEGRELDNLKHAAIGVDSENTLKRRKTGSKRSFMPLAFFSAAAAMLAVWAATGRLLWAGAAVLSALLAAAAYLIKGKETGAAEEKDSQVAADRLQQYEKKLQRVMELKDICRAICNEASIITGQRIDRSGQLKDILSEKKEALSQLESRLEADIRTAAAAGSAAGTGFFEAKSLKDVLAGSSREWLKDSWEYEMEKTEEALLQAALKIKEYETLNKGFGEDGDELQCIEEEIALLEAEKASMERTGAALRLALEVLTESSRELKQSYGPLLNSGMSRIINGITGGRYTDLRADDSLALNTVVPETGFVGGIMALSGGTVDQMYMALRLAASDLLTRGRESLPLILDEAFAQYDDDRLRMTLRYLISEYNDRQIILFTCREREIEAALEVAAGGINIIRLQQA